MKKSRLILAITILTLCAAVISISCVLLFGCGDEPENRVVEISKVDYGFARVEGDIIPDTFSKDYSELKMDTEYYLELKFSVIARYNNLNDLVRATITFENTDILDGRIEESNGTYTSIQFTDGNNISVKESTLDIKIPDKSGEQKDQRILIRLSPQRAGNNTRIRLSFTSAIEMTGNTQDFVKNIPIVKVKLNTPKLTYKESSGYVEFDIEPFVDYYKILLNGTNNENFLKDSNGSDRTFPITDKTLSKSGFFPKDLGIPSGSGVRIVFFSRKAESFTPSDFSNQINLPEEE